MTISPGLTREEATQRWHTKWEAIDALGGASAWSKLLAHHPLRYMEVSTRNRPMCWSEDRKLLCLWGQDIDIGLRIVGHVIPEFKSGVIFMQERDVKQLGWLSDPEGTFCPSNGDGVIWGVVFQLPATKKMLRLVAGYQVGGEELHYVIDMSNIYMDPTNGARDIADLYITTDVARAADDMAKQAAEEEREYLEREREYENG